MTKYVFAIYDSKSEMYSNPVMEIAKGIVIRQFMDLSNDKESNIGRHPEDYSLWYIANYDESKGIYENIPKHECLGKAIEMRKEA